MSGDGEEVPVDFPDKLHCLWSIIKASQQNKTSVITFGRKVKTVSQLLRARKQVLLNLKKKKFFLCKDTFIKKYCQVTKDVLTKYGSQSPVEDSFLGLGTLVHEQSLPTYQFPEN